MKEKLESMKTKYEQLKLKIEDPSLIKDAKKYKETMREYSYLSKLMEEYENYLNIERQMIETKSLIQHESDPELKEMAREELNTLESSFEVQMP